MTISIGLYKKSLAFWTAIFLVFLSIAGALQSQRPSAQTPTIGTAKTLDVKIKLLPNGSTLIDDRASKQAIFPAKNVDRFRLKILDGDPRQFDQFNVNVELPKPTDTKNLNARALLIHSFDNQVQVTTSNRAVQFKARNIAPMAILTITFELPKDYLKLPLGLIIKSQFANLPFWLWLAAGLLFPLVTLIFFVNQLYKRLSIIWQLKKASVVMKPPTNLPPAVVGALHKGKITLREIAATLIDLAINKHLTIYAKPDGDFTFANTPLEPNRLFEKVLLSKLFYRKQIFSRRADVLFRVGHRVFSQKIAKVYWEIYRQLEAGGYFLEPPGRVIAKWKAVSAILFFIGIIGFFAGVIFFPEPKFPLFAWLGVIVGSLIIHSFTHLIINVSPKGLQQLQAWAGFKKYLALGEPVSYQEAIDGRLSRYLPYAVVLGVEKRWLERFAKHPFATPGWFDSYEKVMGLERFGELIFPITGYVGRLLVASREPVI